MMKEIGQKSIDLKYAHYNRIIDEESKRGKRLGTFKVFLDAQNCDGVTEVVIIRLNDGFFHLNIGLC